MTTETACASWRMARSSRYLLSKPTQHRHIAFKPVCDFERQPGFSRIATTGDPGDELNGGYVECKQITGRAGVFPTQRDGDATRQVKGRTRYRRQALIPILVVALVLAAAGCGSSKSSSSSATPASASSSATTSTSIKLAKTKFVLHAGLAFGAFHRWIYKPVKAGYLAHPLQHKAALVKGGLAGAFVIHELKLALVDAQADPTLSKLVAPITALQDKLKSLPSDMKSGTANPADVLSANDQIGAIHQLAVGAGQPITEQTPSTI